MPELLRPALAKCSKIAKTAGSAVDLAVLQGVLHLRVRDAHVSLQTSVPLGGGEQEDGSACVECSRLQALLGVRPDGTLLQLWTDGSALLAKQGEFRAKLPQLRDRVPALAAEGPFDLDMVVPESVFYGMRRCRHSVEDEQAVFAGMLLDFSERHTLRVAAFTRAVLQVAHAEVHSEFRGRIVLAPRWVTVLEVLPKAGFRLAYSVAQSRAYVFSESLTVCVACLEDRYPVKYEAVLGLYRWREGVYPVPLMSSAGEVASERTRSKLVFSTQDVLAALESAAVVLHKEDIVVEMKVGQRLADGRVVVEFIGSNSAGKSHASEKVLATGDVASAISFGLNYVSVRDVLRRLDADVFAMHVGRKDDSIVIDDGHGVVALATLMRL